MHTIFICGDDETICDGYSSEATSAWNEEFATEFVQEAARSIRGSELFGREVDYKVESLFRDWHGGRFDQFYQRCGLLSVAKDAPQAVVDLAWAANESACKARDSYIADRESEAAEFAAEEE